MLARDRLFQLKREFDIIQKEIARRKGEDTSSTTEEEKRICEKVTGFSYENLWKAENAKKLVKDA